MMCSMKDKIFICIFWCMIFCVLLANLFMFSLLSSAEEIAFYSNTLYEISTEETDIVIPEEIDGRKVLKLHLDSDYSNVKTISIPKTLRKIVPYEGDFYDYYFKDIYFENLEYIKVDEKNKIYGSCKGMLYTKSNNTLLVCPVQYSDEEVVIPKNIKIIRYSAFSDCANIREIKIGNNVKKIKKCAFTFLPNLEKVSIKGSVKKIPGSVFWGCKKLKKVKLYQGIEIISTDAFKGCKSLEKVVVPKSTKIENGAFPKKCRIVRK